MHAAEYRTTCRTVAVTFADAFVGYVSTRLIAFVEPNAKLDAAIAEAHDVLRRSLDDWADTAPDDQKASPLELFREALAGPTHAAVDLGAIPVERGDADTATLPGDLLGLAPATSRDLGEDAWKAHVAWGLARAEAVAGMVPRPSPRPAGMRVALVGSDLMDRTKIQSIVEAAGFELLLWRNPAAVADGLSHGLPALALVDLRHAVATDAIRTLAKVGVRTIAYGPHVDDFALAAAGALGAEDALPRSQFFRRLPGLLPRAV